MKSLSEFISEAINEAFNPIQNPTKRLGKSNGSDANLKIMAQAILDKFPEAAKLYDEEILTNSIGAIITGYFPTLDAKKIPDNGCTVAFEDFSVGNIDGKPALIVNIKRLGQFYLETEATKKDSGVSDHSWVWFSK